MPLRNICSGGDIGEDHIWLGHFTPGEYSIRVIRKATDESVMN